MSIVTASAITVQQKDDSLVVDSRLIALQLGIEHLSFLKTIKRYETKIEQRFGTIRFEVHASTMPNGSINPNPEKFAWLDENQAIFLMTLSRNTDQVIECKANLVEAFSKAKEVIKTVIPAQADRIRFLEMELELSRNNKYILDKSDAIRSLHGEGMLALMFNRPDAVVEVVEKVTETIVVNNGRSVSFEGKSTAEMAKELGFKTGVQLENWLRKHKSDHLVCEGFRKVGASYIPTENIKEVKKLWTQKKDRQLLIGE